MVIENKEKLLQSITSRRQYDESFYKHVYYNSKTDKTLSDEIAHKLIEVGRKDIVHAYNEWLSSYLEEREQMLIRVSKWYCEQIDREFERRVNVAEWQNRKKKTYLEIADERANGLQKELMNRLCFKT